MWAGGKCSDLHQESITNSFRNTWIFHLFLSGTQIILLCCLNRCKKSLHTRFILWDLHKQDKFSFYKPLFSLLFVTIIYKVHKKCIDSSKLRIQRVSEGIIKKLHPFRLTTNIAYRNSQYKRKCIVNIFILQVFSLALAFKLHDHCVTFSSMYSISLKLFSLQLFFQLLLIFFEPHASDDLSQDYRNKVISHFHWVNIDTLLMNVLETPKAQFLLLVKIPQDA